MRSSSSPPRKRKTPPLPLPLPPPPPLPASLPPLPPPWTHSRGLPMCPHTRGSGVDLAGVPPEMLPLKKRVVRYHPYAAAWAIQEMASSGNGSRSRHHSSTGDEDGLGLRAELLRLRISRPALLLTKPLTVSDRNRDTGRLILPERLVRASPLLDMLTAPERRLVFGAAGLPVPAFDRRGRLYRMNLRRDPSAGTYLLRGQWTLYLSHHHHMRHGDAVELLAFRPPAWQGRLDKHGEGGIGMAVLLHCSDGWTTRERDAADGLLLIAASSSAASAAAASSSCSCRLLLTGGNGFQTSPLASNSNVVGVS